MDDQMAAKVAKIVEDSLRLKVDVWPGHRQPTIRVKLDDHLEARAEADGFWQVNFFGKNDTGVGSQPLEIPENTENANELAGAIVATIVDRIVQA